MSDTVSKRPSFADYPSGADMVTPKVAAALLGLQPRTLEAYRAKGGGPRFVRLGEGGMGRCRYQVSELLAWVASKTCASNTTG